MYLVIFMKFLVHCHIRLVPPVHGPVNYQYQVHIRNSRIFFKYHVSQYLSQVLLKLISHNALHLLSDAITLPGSLPASIRLPSSLPKHDISPYDFMIGRLLICYRLFVGTLQFPLPLSFFLLTYFLRIHVFLRLYGQERRSSAFNSKGEKKRK